MPPVVGSKVKPKSCVSPAKRVTAPSKVVVHPIPVPAKLFAVNSSVPAPILLTVKAVVVEASLPCKISATLKPV